MKKIFQLQVENKHPDRVIDGIKNEVRKYLKRERSKRLPEDAKFWEFTCSFGTNEQDAKVVTAAEIITSLDSAREQNLVVCYIEITAKPAFKKGETATKE